MVRVASCAVLLLAVSVGCSGKTERGSSGSSGSADAAPVQKPAASPASPEPTHVEPARHLVMVVELEPATHVARTLAARSVDLPLPRRRGPAQQAPWRVDVLGNAGLVLYTAPLEDAATVRGEFRDDKTGETKGATTERRVAAVTLRLPWVDGASEVRVVSVNENGDTELGRVAYPKVMP
jgi:hypothetical protein